MPDRAPRVFYVPNEFGGFEQVGFREPMRQLTEAGKISALEVFSVLDAVRRGGDAEEHRRELVRRVEEFRPDVLLMQHLGGTGLRATHFASLKAACGNDFIYHEADPYSRWLHPLPSEAQAAGRAADVVFTVGKGTFAENFRRSGAKAVRWTPSAYEPNRSSNFVLPVRTERPYDVVIVANRNRPRLRGLPNWRERIRFVEAMQGHFGDRLAVFGRGWEGATARGAVPFEQQDEAITAGWVSANWDHFAGEHSYFSNRLPISLAAGSIHATTEHPGYRDVFGDETASFLLRARKPVELIALIENTLATTSQPARVEAIEAGRRFAARTFRQDDLMLEMLNWRTRWIDPIEARAIWSSSGNASP